MYGERKYLVNMNMSFCFESSGACLLSFKLLEDTLLPKVLCSWDSTPGEVLITFNLYNEEEVNTDLIYVAGDMQCLVKTVI